MYVQDTTGLAVSFRSKSNESDRFGRSAGEFSVNTPADESGSIS